MIIKGESARMPDDRTMLRLKPGDAFSFELSSVDGFNQVDRISKGRLPRNLAPFFIMIFLNIPLALIFTSTASLSIREPVL